MIPRDWRFWAVSGLLVLALFVCSMARVADIQQDLLVRAQRALAAAEIPYYGLEIDGRDALLRGPVESPAEGERVRRVVSSVPGIRVVRDALIVESFPDRTVPPATRRTLAPTLRLQRLGDRLFVRGRLPDTGVVEELERELEAAGIEVAASDLRQGPRVAEADWMARLDTLVGLLGALEETGVLVIQGGTASLNGVVSDEVTGGRLRAAATGMPGLTWRFDLFSVGGSMPTPGDD